MVKPHKLLDLKIKWMATGDPTAPFAAEFKGQHLAIQVNDFPASHLYTLVIDRDSVLSFDEWPDVWLRPAA